MVHWNLIPYKNKGRAHNILPIYVIDSLISKKLKKENNKNK
jgi:hypothetical protein